MIYTYIDATDFSHCSPRSYKHTRNINDLIPSTLCTEYSRYEVLQQQIRKIYFDVDGVKDEDFSLVRNFADSYNEFMMSKGYIKEPIEFAYTINTASANHSGLSSHIVAVKTTMDAKKQHTVLLEFLSEHPGADKFRDYVDTSVYSKRQLFKLPHFIGLPIGNMENYHNVVGDSKLTDFVIQHTLNCKYINPNMTEKPEHRKAERKLSYIPQRGNTKILKNIYAALLKNTGGVTYNTYKYIDLCNELLLRENLSDAIKKKILEIQADLTEKKNIETSIGLLEHIKQKLDRI